MNRGWAPSYLVRSYFDQSTTWVTADGRRLWIPHMEFDHALNALLMLERVADDVEEHLRDERVQDTPLYAGLKARVRSGP